MFVRIADLILYPKLNADELWSTIALIYVDDTQFEIMAIDVKLAISVIYNEFSRLLNYI